VEQAEEMVKEGPWSLKAVESTAEVVEPMDLVTLKEQEHVAIRKYQRLWFETRKYGNLAD
jgi:hypothetical protein